jgi:N-acylneuraminate cytidylyltransferase
MILIPARGGSKSVPLKNIMPIAGRPLIHWSLDAACGVGLPVFVSTDSRAIEGCVGQHPGGAVCIERNPYTATDEASTASVMLDFIRRVECNFLVVVQCTSPLLTTQHLREGISKFHANDYDSLVSVVRQHRFVWKEEDGYAYPVNHRLLERPRRQDWDGMLVENGAFIITKVSSFLRTRSRLSGRVGLYEMPAETYTELDEPVDKIIIERLLEARCQEK